MRNYQSWLIEQSDSPVDRAVQHLNALLGYKDESGNFHPGKFQEILNSQKSWFGRPVKIDQKTQIAIETALGKFRTAVHNDISAIATGIASAQQPAAPAVAQPTPAKSMDTAGFMKELKRLIGGSQSVDPDDPKFDPTEFVKDLSVRLGSKIDSGDIIGYLNDKKLGKKLAGLDRIIKDHPVWDLIRDGLQNPALKEVAEESLNLIANRLGAGPESMPPEEKSPEISQAVQQVGSVINQAVGSSLEIDDNLKKRLTQSVGQIVKRNIKDSLTPQIKDVIAKGVRRSIGSTRLSPNDKADLMGQIIAHIDSRFDDLKKGMSARPLGQNQVQTLRNNLDQYIIPLSSFLPEIQLAQNNNVFLLKDVRYSSTLRKNILKLARQDVRFKLVFNGGEVDIDDIGDMDTVEASVQEVREIKGIDHNKISNRNEINASIKEFERVIEENQKLKAAGQPGMLDDNAKLIGTPRKVGSEMQGGGEILLSNLDNDAIRKLASINTIFTLVINGNEEKISLDDYSSVTSALSNLLGDRYTPKTDRVYGEPGSHGDAGSNPERRGKIKVRNPKKPVFGNQKPSDQGDTQQIVSHFEPFGSWAKNPTMKASMVSRLLGESDA